MKIRRHDIADVLAGLPELEVFEPVALGGFDLVVCSMGFEDRSPSIGEALAAAGSLRQAVVALVHYPTNPAENECNRARFEAVGCAAAGVEVLKYSRTSILEEFRSLLGRTRPRRVLLDISTCSSYLFYPLMRDLLERDADLSIAYTAAEQYYPTEQEWREVAARADRESRLIPEVYEEAHFLSVGVDDVYSGNYFSEMNSGNRPACMIAVPNFSALRMNAIARRDAEINKTKFEDTYWVIGVPPLPENQWRVAALKRTNNLGMAPGENLVTVSTLHYKEMLQTLEDLWSARRQSHFLSVGNLGSKMQHLGAFFFHWLHPDCGMWLAEPTSFQTGRYSQGVSTQYVLRFAETPKLRSALARYMKFSWEF